ncbi:MAG: protein 2 3 complex subunit [Marteilia pararefringens]
MASSSNMKLLKQLKFDFPVQAHAFNADRSRVAISHYKTSIHEDAYNIFIYETSSVKAKLLCKLPMHISTVKCLDWSKKGNKILSCSTDMNCYVWEESSKNQWNKVMVQGILRFSASICRWSPDEKYLVLGSVSGNLCICSYVPQYNWWAAKKFKDQTSAIMDIKWSPNSEYFAIACADRFFKLFKVSSAPKPIFSLVSPYYGFTTSVAFNASGNLIASVSQDSSITIYDISKDAEKPSHKTTLLDTACMTAIAFIDDKTIIASGFNQQFYCYTVQNDLSVVMQSMFGGASQSDSNVMNAMQKFKNMDFKGTSEATGSAASKTLHKKHINDIIVDKNTFSASSYDNSITIWSR